MLIDAALPEPGVVLAGKQQGVAHKLHIVQHRLSAGRFDLVVPIHHHALAFHIDGVVIDILLHIHHAAAHLPLVLRVLLVQHLLVHQVHNEQVAALLDVGDTRLPEDFQQVNGGDVDVS